jgi:hypothetical protein
MKYDAWVEAHARDYNEDMARREAAEEAAEAAALAADTYIAEPLAIAIGGWLNAQTVARNAAQSAPRYAAIGNGLFVRVGNGNRRRA